MKVLLAIHEFFPESTGGAEVLLLDSAKMLRDRGHEVRVLTGRPVKTPVEDEKRWTLMNTTAFLSNGSTMRLFLWKPVEHIRTGI